MRIPFAVVAVILSTAACKKAPPPPPPAMGGQEAVGATLTGKVAETFDASSYTYLRLQTASGEAWAAVPTTKAAIGSDVTVTNVAWMENFKSKTLNRTWEKIAFGTLAGAGAPQAGAAPQAAAEAMPAGHPAMDGQQQGAPNMGMFAAQAAGAGGAPMAHPTPSAGADLGSIKVAKASGPNGRTVADVYKARTQLKDKNVAVRGKVVKATNGVMGKNWVHVRDGSGEGPTSDLTIASNDTAAVGDTVLVTGVVHLDRDLGAGYHYDVLIEDAQIKKE